MNAGPKGPLLFGHGPVHARSSTEVTIRGRRVTVALVVGVRSGSDRLDPLPDGSAEEGLERALMREGLQGLRADQPTITGRMRAAIAAMHALMASRGPGGANREREPGGGLVASAVIVALSDPEWIVGCAGGAAVVTSSAGDDPRHADDDDRDETRPAGLHRAAGTGPGLGEPIGAPDPSIRWIRVPDGPGVRLLIAAGSIDGAAAARLLTADEGSGADGPGVEEGEPAGTSSPTAALVVERPPERASSPIRPPPTGSRDAQRSERTSAPAARGMATRLTSRLDRWKGGVGNVVRGAGVATLRATARVMLDLFPARMAGGERRSEWARLMAAAAVALPIAALILTAYSVRSMDGPSRDPAPPSADPSSSTEGPTSGSAATSALSVASDAPQDRGGFAEIDEAAGIRRLSGQHVATLSGAPEDPRKIVAAGGELYVLNTAAGLLEYLPLGNDLSREVAPAARTVMRTGDFVETIPVAGMLDLFWLPAPGSVNDGSAALLDRMGRVYALSGGVAEPLPDLSWPPSSAPLRADGYDGALYALTVDRRRAGEEGQVLRFEPVDGGWPPRFTGVPESRLAGGKRPVDPLDFAIDGTILVQTGSGNLLRFVGGRHDDQFQVTGMPDPVEAPCDLYASPTAGRILQSDATRGEIVALGSDGRFRARLRTSRQPGAAPRSAASDGRLRDVCGVWWDERGGDLWWTQGNAVVRASYDVGATVP